MKYPATIFVTGIDTDAGKTYATAWLANRIKADGQSVITQKFIQTGCRDQSEDILKHRELMGIGLQPRDLDHTTAPIILTYPASADLAARIDGVDLDFTVVEKATDTLRQEYDHVIVEGAGGLMVPLKGEYLTLDYIKEHPELQVALVTNSTLGSINHTLLTLEVMKSHGLNLWALVYNPHFDNEKEREIAADTRKYLKSYLQNHFPDALYLEMEA